MWQRNWRAWSGVTGLSVTIALAGCGNPLGTEDELTQSYLGKMDEVTITPRGTLAEDPASSKAPESHAGGSVENPAEARLELSIPSVQIDMSSAPESDNPAHVFAVETRVLEIRTATEIRRAALDLRLVRKRIEVTDILRYLGIDEQAVLQDLRLQLQNQLREVFLRSFRLELTRDSEVTAHRPIAAEFDCAFQKRGFTGSGFSDSPVSCSTEIRFGEPIESLRIRLRGP